MSEPALVVVRHGATEWSQNGRHTSRTDLPLLPQGRESAAALRQVFAGFTFGRVLCSPLLRARETCELAGFGDRMVICQDLAEWDYGEYEGLTSAQIHELDPQWNLWRDGCPGGESPEQMAERTDRVIALAVEDRDAVGEARAAGAVGAAGTTGGARATGARATGAVGPTGAVGANDGAGDTIAFAHGHVLRVLRARWVAWAAAGGERFALAPAGIAKLGHEHTTRVIERWNTTTL